MPDATLLLDVARHEARVGERTLRAKWFVFWCALATAGPEGLTTDDIRAYRPWNHERWASIGKEMSRHLRATRTAALLKPGQHTRRWVLNAPAAWIPGEWAGREWLAAQRAASDAGGQLNELVRATVGLLCGDEGLLAGRLAEAAEHRDRGSSDEWTAAAWTLLDARALARAEDHEALLTLLERQPKPRSAASRALAARLDAIDALVRRSDDPVAARERVSRAVCRLEGTGDHAGLATCLNVRGVLDLRLGDPAAAETAFAQAATIALLVGDHYLVQGALTNLSLVQARLGKEVDADRSLETALWLSDKLGVGRDSAQTEVWAALRALRRDDGEAAHRWIARALGIVAHLQSDWEHGHFLAARAAVCQRWPEGATNPDRDLAAAERLFGLAGDEVNRERVARARRTGRRG
ncbi:hypothetical protein LBMAG42_16510 [Deltaproteobacteria bacterium]|nr:hypothetical protein LBMAG42_16510 [Deltaproteobacteria bacterium]